MRRAPQGLSMVELVVAFGVFFIACSFLMGTFAFGARLPIHVQRKAESTALAQELLDAKLGQPLTVPITSQPRGPVAGHPGFESEVTVSESSWSPDMDVVTMTVYNPQGSSFALQALRTAPASLTAEELIQNVYGCTSCHMVAGYSSWGGGSTEYYPQWGATQLATGAGLAGFTGPDAVKEYVKESIRDPESFLSLDPNGDPYTAEMQGYPNITDMSEEDIDAIATFLTTLGDPPPPPPPP